MQSSRIIYRLCSSNASRWSLGKQNLVNKTITKRSYRNEAQSSWRSWNNVRQPTGITAENIGRGVVGAASALGVGALCFYGLGLSNEVGSIDTVAFWPASMRQKIKSTYLYFAGGLGTTAIAAYYVSRSSLITKMANTRPMLLFGGSLVAMIGSSMACHAIPYSPPGLNAKHAAWLVHAGVVGTVIAPMMLMGGPLVLRAATYTAGTVLALSLTAACAPDGKFLVWGGPLSLALGGICVASLGGMFVPATSAVAPMISSVVTYGGLVVFGGFMLYDTQKIIRKAEDSAYDHSRVYDPINASMGIYMDTINIFIRILMIMGGNRRK